MRLLKKFKESLKVIPGESYSSYSISLNEGARVYDSPTTSVYSEAEEEYPNGFSFSSAWAPPIDALVELSSQFPELTFVNEYEEGGRAIIR